MSDLTEIENQEKAFEAGYEQGIKDRNNELKEIVYAHLREFLYGKTEAWNMAQKIAEEFSKC